MAARFMTTHRVQFAETDMAGIAHFANFFNWMEEVEHAFFRSLGLSVSMSFEGREIGWPRVAVSCEYRGPVRFEDEVELRLNVTKVGGKSFSYEVEFSVSGARVASGKSTSVCCVRTPDGFKAITIPDAIRAKLL